MEMHGNRALQAYAMMEALWAGGMDFIEIYALMSVKCLEDALEHDRPLTESVLIEFFSAEYGIDNLTKGAARKILKRLKKKQILYQRDDGSYRVDVAALADFIKNRGERDDISSDVAGIIRQLKERADQSCNCAFSEAEIEKGLLNFFSANDGKIAIEEDLDDFRKSPKHKPDTKAAKLKFVISRYVIEQAELDNEVFRTISRFASGHMVATVMAMDDFISFDGSLPSLTVYFDSPLVLALLGLSSAEEKGLVEELVKRLHELKASIKIAAEHCGELRHSIQYAIGMLEQEMPDKSNGNKIYFFALDKGLSADQLRVKLSLVDTVLKEHGIVPESVAPKEAGCQILPRLEIEERITDMFTQGGEYYLPAYRKKSIARDAQVIHRILALGGYPVADSLVHCKAIFATNNIGLCKVSLFKDSDTVVSGIPLCMTPETLSAILWGNRPKLNTALNKTKLVCACVRNITVKASIVRDFYKDMKAKHAAHKISDQDYLNISTSKLVPALLRDETFNIESFYTDEVGMDVLRRVNEQAELKRSRLEQDATDQSDRLKSLSAGIGWGVSILIGAILIVCALLTRFWDWSTLSGWRRGCFVSLAVLFAVWGVLNWTGCFPKFLNIRKWISLKVYNFLSTNHNLTKDNF